MPIGPRLKNQPALFEETLEMAPLCARTQATDRSNALRASR